ncbi:MAG: hypothetical protein A2Y38_08215 [Spirochaetes bacterium GWB1_59_5]|nr:MAG: hypothetical protein A2Y38_08215 [Spirochaetes bacterium GWB1_59_5]
MRTATDPKAKAHDLGKAGAKKGIKAPALDKDFMALMKAHNMDKGFSAKAVLEAYLKGWTEEQHKESEKALKAEGFKMATAKQAALPKKLVNLRDMVDAIAALGEGDKVKVTTRTMMVPWTGEVEKRLPHGVLVKGKGGSFRLEGTGQAGVWFTPAKLKNVKDSVDALMVESKYGDTEGYDQRTGKFNRGGVMYFDIVTEDYNIEEDVSAAEDNDEDAIERLTNSGLGFPPDYSKAVEWDFRAMKELAAMLGVRIDNEGHGSDEALICKFSVSDWAEVKRVADLVKRHTTGGEDQISLDTPYTVAQGFTLFPDAELVNGRSWGNGMGRLEGDLDEWLEAFEPGGEPGPVPGGKTASADPDLYAQLRRVASQYPETRQQLLPLLKKCAATVTELEAGRAYTTPKGPDGAENKKPFGDAPSMGGPGKWKGEKKNKCYYETGDEKDRCYVTTNGGPGGQKKPSSGSAGSDGSPARQEYNKKYRDQRWGK